MTPGLGRTALFALAAFSTVFCAAINAYTYRIAYPLWQWVGQQSFPALHREYLRRLTPVITVPHVVMFFSSGLLLWLRPPYLAPWQAGLLFALDAGVVLVSAAAAGPIHTRFERERTLDPVAFARLLRISALRTGMMLAACVLLLQVLVSALSH